MKKPMRSLEISIIFCSIIENFNLFIFIFRGGVLTPGSAFAKTSLIENLCKYGSTFKIIGEKTKWQSNKLTDEYINFKLVKCKL